MMTRSGCSVAGAFSSTVGATPLTTDVSGAGCSSATSGSGFANNVQIQAPINVKSGYPSEIKAPTPTNAIKAMNQTFVRADSHAPKIDEYLGIVVKCFRSERSSRQSLPSLHPTHKKPILYLFPVVSAGFFVRFSWRGYSSPTRAPH